jgi:hypothetical protein
MVEIIALVQCEMRIADALTLQRGDYPVELGYIGHRPNAHSEHAAARDDIIAHEDLAQAAAAQFLRQAFRIGGVGEGARLYE